MWKTITIHIPIKFYHFRKIMSSICWIKPDKLKKKKSRRFINESENLKDIFARSC